VTTFDARRGWGTVTDSTGAEFEFHATAIADGSRGIDPGTDVGFAIVPGHRGRYEARDVTVVSEAAWAGGSAGASGSSGESGGGSASHQELA
jgi:cold shock CspA family protein